MTRRVKVGRHVAANVEFLSDLRCCICHDRGHQIHHLNGDHSDNIEDNLALLCFEHHDDATRTGGLSRKLNPETIRVFRSQWYIVVAHRRSATKRTQLRTRDPANRLSEQLLLSLARHEVRKLGFTIDELLSTKWPPELTAALRELAPYAAMGTPDLGLDVLDILCSVAAYTRAGMTADVAHMIHSVATSAMPTGSLQTPKSRKTKSVELAALELGCELGRNIAYDAGLYLRDLVVFDVGVSILWALRRSAHLNKQVGLMGRVEDAFDSARDGAKRARGGQFQEALRWLEFKRLDALALDDGPPSMPNDLANLIYASSKGDPRKS